MKFTDDCCLVRQSNSAGDQQHNLDSVALHSSRIHSSNICIAKNDAVLPYRIDFFEKNDGVVLFPYFTSCFTSIVSSPVRERFVKLSFIVRFFLANNSHI